jgi:hypothetical protein
MPGSTALRTWLATTKGRANRDLFTFYFRSGTERWTSAPAAVTVGSNTWTANSRISNEQELSFDVQANGTDADELKLVIVPHGATLGGLDFIHAADLGDLDSIKVAVERFFPDSGLAETLPLFAGYVDEVKVLGVTVELTIKTRQALAASSTPVIRLQAGCPFAFGDINCCVNLALWTSIKSCAAGGTTSKVVYTGTADANANMGSVVTFTSGANNGRSVTVETVTGTSLGIYPPLPSAPVAGDTFTVVRGCPKTIAACGTFSNRKRYIGFPYAPNPEATT